MQMARGACTERDMTMTFEGNSYFKNDYVHHSDHKMSYSEYSKRQERLRQRYESTKKGRP